MRSIIHLYIGLGILIPALFSCQNGSSENVNLDQEDEKVDTISNDQMISDSGTVKENVMKFTDEIAFAKYIADALESKNFELLQEYTSKEVLLSPYAFIDSGSVQRLSVDEMIELKNNGDKHFWGIQDGTGDSLNMTLDQYLDRYVTDFEIGDTSIVKYNKVSEPSQRGNEMHNVSEFFTDLNLVEIHKEATDDMGMNWRTLILVIKSTENGFKLQGVIHNEWTI